MGGVGVGREGAREQGKGQGQLGTSWGAQMEQVRKWNDGRVKMEGQCLERWMCEG